MRGLPIVITVANFRMAMVALLNHVARKKDEIALPITNKFNLISAAKF